ncbi:MAG TPA: hypothetical protein VMC48_02485 [Methanobacterium sp.]|nr:hypothetical protein [Methanobacterium sp.]
MTFSLKVTLITLPGCILMDLFGGSQLETTGEVLATTACELQTKMSKNKLDKIRVLL